MISQKDEESNSSPQKLSDFSIEHILNRAGTSFSRTSNVSENECEVTSPSVSLENFHWLQCSRYCPPKVPRVHRKEPPQKRQLGRHPRIPFTSTQLLTLEQKFHESPYLSSEEVTILSRKLQLADIRIKIWFQNRRARERREKQQAVTGVREKEKNKKTVNRDSNGKCDTNFGQSNLSSFHSFNSVFPILTSATVTTFNSICNSVLSSQSIPFFASSNEKHFGLGDDNQEH